MKAVLHVLLIFVGDIYSAVNLTFRLSLSLSLSSDMDLHSLPAPSWGTREGQTWEQGASEPAPEQEHEPSSEPNHDRLHITRGAITLHELSRLQTAPDSLISPGDVFNGQALHISYWLLWRASHFCSFCLVVGSSESIMEGQNHSDKEKVKNLL